MFEALERINERPEPFQFYTASDLWTDTHTSKQMLALHLDEAADVSSRNAPFIDRSVEWIAARFGIRKGTRIADFGCGPGLYAARLAKRGARVTGIDFSRRSIEHAAHVATAARLDIRYITRDYLEFETEERFDLVLMIMCDFCALSPRQRTVMLDKFYRFLNPGGCVLLDVYALAAFEKRREIATYEADLLDGFWSSEKYYGFLNTFKYHEDKVVLDKYTIVEKDRTRVVFNWLQYFAPEDLGREFVKAGFVMGEIYSDVAGAPYNCRSSEFAVIASKG